MTDEQQADRPNDLETAKVLSEKIEVARQAGRYMVAVFHVDAESKLHLNRGCHNFPVVDFENVIKLLKTDLEQEKAGIMPQPQRETMEQAAPVAPVIDLFGKKPEDADGS